LSGANIDLLSKVCARTQAKVVASGGVACLDDIRVLASMTNQGIEAVIIGTALYLKSFTLMEALSLARGE
jgi:phosphoribosylanthranilate isomerase